MWNCSYLQILAGAIRLFPRLKTPYFQNKAKGKDFCENDFNLHENKLKSFVYKWLCAKPRFETDGWGNSEMAYFNLRFYITFNLFLLRQKFS